MDGQVDLDNPPSDIQIPSTLTADGSQQIQQMDGDGGAVTMIPFPFCLLFSQKPWATITVAAPSPELAELTISQYVQLINKTLEEQYKYPPNMCSARAGSC